MHTLLGDYIATRMLVFLDDVLVYSDTPAGLVENTRLMLSVLAQHGIKLKPKSVSCLRHNWCGAAALRLELASLRSTNRLFWACLPPVQLRSCSSFWLPPTGYAA